MRVHAQIVVLLLLLCGIAVAQAPDAAPVQTPDQQPATDPNADPRDNRQRPLTPEEERERQIRLFDPLYRGDPNAPFETTPESVPAPNPEPAPQQEQKSTGQNSTGLDAPLPGSIASGERQNRGPQVVGDDDSNAAPPEYTGPAVLSRAYTVNRPMIAQDVKWIENFGFSFTFSSGTTSASLTPAGTITANGNLYGIGLTAGFGGRKLFHRDQLGIRFGSQYQENFPLNENYSGPNNNLAVDYSHVISRRLSLNLVGTGSMFSQNYTLQNPVVEPDISVANINLASSPNIQIFDSSTKQFNAQASLTWQLNARISFNFGGGYFAIIRDNPALLGTNGEQAQGDMNYRWTQKTTVGVYYSYSHYQYQHGAGASDSNTLGLIYSYAFSRTLQLRFRGGGSRIESISLTQVPLPPAIVALLGIPVGVVDGYTKNSSTDISAQLVKDLGTGRTASIAFAKGLSPGNGLYQASEQESISISFGAKFRRVYQIGVSAGRDTLSSVAQAIGTYSSENVQVSVSRPFRGGFSSTLQISYRHFGITSTTPVSGQYYMSTGISWGPPNGKLWPF